MKKFLISAAVLTLGMVACGPDSNSANHAQGLPLGTQLQLRGVSKDLEQNREKLAGLRASLASESAKLDICLSKLRSLLQPQSQASAQVSLAEQASMCDKLGRSVSSLKEKIADVEARILDLEKRHTELSKLVNDHRLDGQEKKLSAQKTKRDSLQTKVKTLEKDFQDWKCLEKLSGTFEYGQGTPLTERQGKVMQCSVLRTHIDAAALQLGKVEAEIAATEKAITELLGGGSQSTPAPTPAPVKQAPAATPEPAPAQAPVPTPALIQQAPVAQPSLTGCHWIYAGSVPLYSAPNASSKMLTPTQGEGKGKQGYIMGGGTFLYVHGETSGFLHVTVKRGTFLGREGYITMAAGLDLVKTNCPEGTQASR